MSAAKRAEVLRESFEHTENSFKSYTSQLSEASKAIGPLLERYVIGSQVHLVDPSSSLCYDYWPLISTKLNINTV